MMPNFRAVSAGALPPPPTKKEAFKIATQNSFDYSAFIFTGFTSALAEWSDAHPQLGEGMKGYGRYYWRGFVDKTDGNYLVIFALPTIFHQDERYYALGKGSIWKRLGYSMSRVAITPDYNGHDSFNASELLGRGMAQGISLAYYPSQTSNRRRDRGEIRIRPPARRPHERLPRILAGHRGARIASPSVTRRDHTAYWRWATARWHR